MDRIQEKPDSLIGRLVQFQPLQAKVELSGSIVPQSSEKGNTSEGKTPDQFSMKTPFERADKLILWHNMSEDALESALELGGLAMPSRAIKPAGRGHTTYGKVSIIASRAPPSLL